MHENKGESKAIAGTAAYILSLILNWCKLQWVQLSQSKYLPNAAIEDYF